VTVDPKPLLLAHRGDHRAAPENTIEAFQAALSMPGCGGVELDVRASRDGQAVVIHDATLERVQRQPGRVADFTADELARFGVPRLADVFAALPAGAFIDMELKEAVVGQVLAAIDAARGPAGAGTAISSFSADILREVMARQPSWQTWLISAEVEALVVAAELVVSGVAVDWHAITPAWIRAAARLGLEVVAWTVRNEGTLGRMRDLGVDAVCIEGAALGPMSTP
jgi:glycerophosphoryl diester phosphodiesterase